jgi:hypothetical protein
MSDYEVIGTCRGHGVTHFAARDPGHHYFPRRPFMLCSGTTLGRTEVDEEGYARRISCLWCFLGRHTW